MQGNMKTARRLMAALAFWQLVSNAHADVVTYAYDVPLQFTAWNATALIPRFNPAQGELQGVELVLQTHIEGTARFESRDPAPTTIATSFSANLKLRRPDLGTDVLTAAPSFQFADPVSAF